MTEGRKQQRSTTRNIAIFVFIRISFDFTSYAVVFDFLYFATLESISYCVCPFAATTLHVTD